MRTKLMYVTKFTVSLLFLLLPFGSQGQAQAPRLGVPESAKGWSNCSPVEGFPVWVGHKKKSLGIFLSTEYFDRLVRKGVTGIEIDEQGVKGKIDNIHVVRTDPEKKEICIAASVLAAGKVQMPIPLEVTGPFGVKVHLSPFRDIPIGPTIPFVNAGAFEAGFSITGIETAKSVLRLRLRKSEHITPPFTGILQGTVSKTIREKAQQVLDEQGRKTTEEWAKKVPESLKTTNPISFVTYAKDGIWLICDKRDIIFWLSLGSNDPKDAAMNLRTLLKNTLK